MNTNENKEDIRVIRTKRDLANALEELLGEKNIQDIQIKDITDRAMISKNTFYNNFNDKNELLIYLFQRYEDKLIKEVKPILEKTFVLTKLFNFKKAIEIIVHFFYSTDIPFSKIIQNDHDRVLFYALNIFIQDVFKSLNTHYENFLNHKVDDKISILYFSGAFSSLIYFAYQNNLSIPEKDMVYDILRLSYAAVE